jgi:hypothetical protein
MIPGGVWCNGGVSAVLFNRGFRRLSRRQAPPVLKLISASLARPYIGDTMLHLRLRLVRAAGVTELLRVRSVDEERGRPFAALPFVRSLILGAP